MNFSLSDWERLFKATKTCFSTKRYPYPNRSQKIKNKRMNKRRK